jgi:hypothetical protein
VYPSNLQLLQADVHAAAVRQREAGRRAHEALPRLPDRLRAGVRVVSRRRVVAFG